MTYQVNLKGLLALDLLNDEFDYEAPSGYQMDSRARSVDNDQALIDERREGAMAAFVEETIAINKNIKQMNAGETSSLHYLSAEAGSQLIKRLTPEYVVDNQQGGNRHVFNQGEADVWITGLLDQAKNRKGYVRNGLVSVTKAIDGEISAAMRDEGQKRLQLRQPSMTQDEQYDVVLDVLKNKHGMTDANVDFFLYMDEMKQVLKAKES